MKDKLTMTDYVVSNQVEFVKKLKFKFFQNLQELLFKDEFSDDRHSVNDAIEVQNEDDFTLILVDRIRLNASVEG